MSEKKILIESMTRTKYYRYQIRCWREEESYSDEVKKQTRKDIETVKTELGMKGFELSIEAVAKKFLAVPRMNAVEVLNGDGDGVVIYSDWP